MIIALINWHTEFSMGWQYVGLTVLVYYFVMLFLLLSEAFSIPLKITLSILRIRHWMRDREIPELLLTALGYTAAIMFFIILLL